MTTTINFKVRNCETENLEVVDEMKYSQRTFDNILRYLGVPYGDCYVATYDDANIWHEMEDLVASDDVRCISKWYDEVEPTRPVWFVFRVISTGKVFAYGKSTKNYIGVDDFLSPTKMIEVPENILETSEFIYAC